MENYSFPDSLFFAGGVPMENTNKIAMIQQEEVGSSLKGIIQTKCYRNTLLSL